MKRLTKEHLNCYQKQGYLLPNIQLFDQATQQELTLIFEEHLAGKGTKKSDELDTPHFHDKRLLDFLLKDSVLDIVEDLIGPNIGLFSSHFISKEAGKGRRTPWHEDSSYWEGRFDHLDKIVTIWLAIDATSVDNGCMGVIPESHLKAAAEYENVEDPSSSTFETEIKSGTFNPKDIVWFELEKGHFSLHDARIIHGANANTSNQRRAGYTMRYFALDMAYQLDKHADHKLWYCRGENLAGNELL